MLHAPGWSKAEAKARAEARVGVSSRDEEPAGEQRLLVGKHEEEMVEGQGPKTRGISHKMCHKMCLSSQNGRHTARQVPFGHVE